MIRTFLNCSSDDMKNAWIFITFGCWCFFICSDLAACLEVHLTVDPPAVYSCTKPVSARCDVDAPPDDAAGEVEWRFGDLDVKEVAGFRVRGHRNGENRWWLDIPCPQVKHTGVITCRARSVMKPLTYESSSAVLTVMSLPPDMFIQSDPFVVVKTNATAKLKCFVSLMGPDDDHKKFQPNVTWYRHDKLLVDGGTAEADGGRFSLTLEIPKVTSDDGGIYQCKAYAGTREVVSETALLTKDMLVPTRLHVQVFGKDSGDMALLFWTNPKIPGLPEGRLFTITEYRILLRSPHRDVENTLPASYMAPDTFKMPKHMWRNFTEGEGFYKFSVLACLAPNKCGKSSDTFTVAVFKDFPRPENVSITCRYDNISFQSYIDAVWDAPAAVLNQSVSTSHLSYRVEVSSRAEFRDSQSKMQLEKLHHTYETSHTSWKHLVASNTNYSVRVCVVTAYGCGQMSSDTLSTSCSTPPNVPSELPAFELQTVDSSSDSINLKLDLQRITERYGPIKCYRVILYKLKWDQMENLSSVSVVLSTYEEVHKDGAFGAYVAEAFDSEHFQPEVVLGDEKQTNCFEPGPYDPHTRRRRRRRNATAEKGGGGEWNVVSSLLSARDGRLQPDTSYSGFLEITVVGFGGKELRRRSSMFPPIRTNLDDYSSVLPLALGIVCGLSGVILVLIVALCVLRRKVVNTGPVETPILPQPSMKPIKKEELTAAYVQRHKDSDLLFQREYELLPEYFKDRTSRASDNVDNFFKNRYPDIKAYDQTRVKLTPLPGIAASDYINANYVHGYKGRKKFICAQGPLDKTVNDFWRMIWEQKVELIAMVTGLEENGKTKCAKYWPDSGENKFGDIIVTITEEVIYGEYAVRKFTVKGSELSLEQNGVTMPLEVVHFHYLVWKDFLAPDHPGGTLKFIRRIREAYAKKKGHILVHCSAGVGRTGTLVAIDSLLDQMEEEGQVDVFHFVATIRRSRNFLVQSLTQYIFIYRALMEYAQFNDTEVEGKQLAAHLKHLETSKDGDKSLLVKEFEKLDDLFEDYKTTDIGTMDVFAEKNRYDFIVPFDNNRVMLTMLPTTEHSTYINASIIQGYDRSPAYIITQDPLECTVGDFWRMIHEQCVHVVVMLSKIGEEQNECGQYWPDGEQAYNHILVTQQDNDEYASTSFTVRKFLVTNKKSSRSHSVWLFQYGNWEGETGSVPETPTRLLGLIQVIHKIQTEDPNKEPIVVHCSGGGDRSSVFTAVSILVRQLESEGRVDVFHVVSSLRTQRKFMIQSLAQYHFCYKAALEYSKTYAMLK